VVPEGHQGGEKIEDDRGVDEVHPFPHGVGNSIGAWGGGGGALGEGEPDLFLGEGDGRGVPCQATSARKGVSGGKEVV